MRFSIIAVLFVIASACALPEQQIDTKNERIITIIITNQIRSAIEQIRRQIRAAGLDPLKIDRADYVYKPMPFVEIEAFIDQLIFTGPSNIVINQLSYNIIQNSVKFTLSIPELRLSINDSGIDALVFESSYSGRLNGGVSIIQVLLIGDIRLLFNIFTGISIRSVSLQFSISTIQSTLQCEALGNDYSNDLNVFLGTTIPNALIKYRNQINRELSKIVLDYLRKIM